MIIPLNRESHLKSLKALHQNQEDKTSFQSPDEQYNFFLEQSNRKLDEFLKYNSVVDMSYRNKKIDFLEWEFKLKLSEFNRMAGNTIILFNI